MDDAAEILVLMRDLLEPEGYRVSTAALPLPPATLTALAPDLLLLDVTFHGAETGWEALTALRGADGLRGVPIFLCTGASRVVRGRAAELAARKVGVVFKPFAVDHLLAEIERRLGRQRPHASVGRRCLGPVPLRPFHRLRDRQCLIARARQ